MTLREWIAGLAVSLRALREEAIGRVDTGFYADWNSGRASALALVIAELEQALKEDEQEGGK